jgi:hypothetical protein
MRLWESIADIIVLGLSIPDPGLDRQPAYALALDESTGQRVEMSTYKLPLSPSVDELEPSIA